MGWEALVYTDSACPDSEPKCGLVALLYLDDTRRINQANRGKSKNDAWDRKHVWPKSRGFKKQSQDSYTDLHHLRPADRNINGAHSNYGFGMGGQPSIGDLCTLVEWNEAFPVTDFEKRCNDRVEELQGNRNPFIDHPEFVDAIWANECS